MISLLLILIVIALIDSTSMVPIAILPFAAILAGKRPILGAMSFITGIFVIYFLSGLLLFLGFDLVFDVIASRVSRWWNQPNTIELILQLFVGVALLVYAWIQYRRPKAADNKVTRSAISLTQAWTLGGSLTLIGIPGAIPYFGAIEQILRAHLTLFHSIIAVFFYNIAFIFPFFTLLFIRLLLPNQSGMLFGRLSIFIQRWGKPIMVGCIVILGGLLVVDSIGWFLGHPVLPIDVNAS